MSDEVLTLQETADALGVHYMTAYRYVRLGQLEAYKSGGGWRVDPGALDAFRAERRADAHLADSARRAAPWGERLEARLLAGDAAGAWGVVEAAMAAGTEVGDVYSELLTDALRSIGDRWANGEIDVAVEHRASGIASRIVGRLGSRCVRRGRSRGTILLGAVAGEQHSLALAILGDLLRLEGWEVSDLGANTPVESFAVVAPTIDDLVAIGVSAMHPQNLEQCAATCARLRQADLGVPIVVGGQAVRDAEHARELGADAYASDAASMLALLTELVDEH
jgi:excisionase family DNA binding protein